MTPTHECPNCGDRYEDFEAMMDCMAAHNDEQLRNTIAVLTSAMHEIFVAMMLNDGQCVLWSQTWAETMPKDPHEWERN